MLDTEYEDKPIKTAEDWIEYIKRYKQRNGSKLPVAIAVPTKDFLALVNDFKQVCDSNNSRRAKIASLESKLYHDVWNFAVCKAKRCAKSEGCRCYCRLRYACKHSEWAYRRGNVPTEDFFEKFKGPTNHHGDYWTRRQEEPAND